MKRILVTGGAGFIGSSVIDELLATTDCTIACLDNFDDTYERQFKLDNISSSLATKRCVLYEVDITDVTATTAVFTQFLPTHVLHLAAKADTRQAVTDPFSYIDTNISGTTAILEAAVATGVAHVVAASSSSVYGNSLAVPWREDNYAIKPISPYGVTKLSTEYLAYSYFTQFQLPVTMLRYFNVYGERNRPGMVPYLWTEAILKNKPIEISGDGSRRRDYTYIGDIVAGTCAALKQPLGYEVINLGYGSPLSLRELQAIFFTITGGQVEVRSRPSHSASVECTYADNTKAKQLLGWSPTTPPPVGFKKLVDWFAAHRLE